MYIYMTHWESGSFSGQGGEDRLNNLLILHGNHPEWEIVAVVPVVKDGKTAGVLLSKRRAKREDEK